LQLGSNRAKAQNKKVGSGERSPIGIRYSTPTSGTLATQARPIHIKAVEDEGGVVDLENNQQENQKQSHENSHERSCSPAGGYFTVFSVEGAKDVAQTGTLCHVDLYKT